MPNNIAGREVDLERKKFHLDDYGVFQVNAVAGKGARHNSFLRLVTLMLGRIYPGKTVVLLAKSHSIRRD
jgi:hypothetical protein